MAEINHADIVRFAADRVNLPADKAQQHRDQVNRLRDRTCAGPAVVPGRSRARSARCRTRSAP